MPSVAGCLFSGAACELPPPRKRAVTEEREVLDVDVLFVGAGPAGLAGALYASWAEIVTPGLFSLGQSAEIIIWCIVGTAVYQVGWASFIQ